MNLYDSTRLNLKNMAITYEVQHFETFWAAFCLEIKRATKLQELVLYKCTNKVLHRCIQVLPQLSILNATSIM